MGKMINISERQFKCITFEAFSFLKFVKTDIASLHFVFVACGKVYNSVYGSIKSPEVPGHYLIPIKCRYLIKQLDPAARITLTLERFNLQRHVTCAYHSVKIYDGESINANQLGPSYGFCGTAASLPLTSTGNSVLIVFTSQAYLAASLFFISYRGEFV